MKNSSIQNRSGFVLAFDFGLRYIGVASGQTITRTATSLTTLKAVNGRPNWTELLVLIESWHPVQLLVGLPLNMDDSESEMCELARSFALKLERRCGVPVTLVDERLTTIAAQEIDPADRHGLAAVLIAETWFGDKRSDRVSVDT